MPERVQLRRTKGWRMPPNTRVVTRSTIFGNPWACDTANAFWWPNDPRGQRWLSTHRVPRLILLDLEAVSLFRGWLMLDYVPRGALPVGLTSTGLTECTHALERRRATILGALPGLRGKNLACWCSLDHQCHAAVLLELASR